MFKLRWVLAIIAAIAMLSGCSTKTPITPMALLYDNSDAGATDGHYVSTEFATPSSNSNNINVWFDNKGASSVTVTFQKKGFFGTWSNVGSFAVNAGKADFRQMAGASGTTYRIKVDSSIGSPIKGHLKANQL
ncbi:hypothetical protein BEP19_00440 [Ammoniphilus oxalaticus]|uniref:Lipoprotein n=1 Tax=Ammoniphilus oxalaticus TaxID=66863 RepID=A0A419SRA0_9BACL|nr:hypothetical protein [Ammoniphilus oxalaticus]RKD27076.1 hypothetical protein BEP19_00440 [Ammoniphilus oxalaticus]